MTGSKDVVKNLERKIKKADPSSEQTYDIQSLKQWRMKYMNKLRDYLELPDSYLFTMIQYIVYTKSYENTSINYSAVYKELYEVE